MNTNDSLLIKTNSKTNFGVSNKQVPNDHLMIIYIIYIFKLISGSQVYYVKTLLEKSLPMFYLYFKVVNFFFFI